MQFLILLILAVATVLAQRNPKTPVFPRREKFTHDGAEDCSNEPPSVSTNFVDGAECADFAVDEQGTKWSYMFACGNYTEAGGKIFVFETPDCSGNAKTTPRFTPCVKGYLYSRRMCCQADPSKPCPTGKRGWGAQ